MRCRALPVVYRSFPALVLAHLGRVATARENLGGSRIITHAEGCYITDGDGNRILDGMAGLWCVNVGYGREELVEVAAEQMRDHDQLAAHLDVEDLAFPDVFDVGGDEPLHITHRRRLPFVSCPSRAVKGRILAKVGR